MRRANISNKVHRFTIAALIDLSLNSAGIRYGTAQINLCHAMRIRPDICALPCIGKYSRPLRHRKGDGLLRQHIAKLIFHPDIHRMSIAAIRQHIRVTRCHLHRNNLCAGGIATNTVII